MGRLKVTYDIRRNVINILRRVEGEEKPAKVQINCTKRFAKVFRRNPRWRIDLVKGAVVNETVGHPDSYASWEDYLEGREVIYRSMGYVHLRGDK